MLSQGASSRLGTAVQAWAKTSLAYAPLTLNGNLLTVACFFLQAVRLESARPHRIRYLLVVSAEDMESENETVLLGVDFPEER